MPPKGGGRGRKRSSASAASFVEDLREEVEESLRAENAVLSAFRELSSAKMTVDAIRSLPSKLVHAYVSSKFDHHVISFVTSSLVELAVLPVSLRLETVAKFSALSLDEASICFMIDLRIPNHTYHLSLIHTPIMSRSFFDLVILLSQASLLYEACSTAEKSYPTCSKAASTGLPVILTPPTGTCVECSRSLTEHNRPCDVSVHGFHGKMSGLKFSLRCDLCKLNYNYDRYGSKTRGWCLYKERRPLIEASDVCFVERKLLDFQCALANHSWVSFSGFSTAYNETFQLLGGDGEYGEKQCSSAFWNGELESELRELGNLNFFGLMKKNEDREKVMEEVDKIRAKSVYSHPSSECSETCKKRGCGRLWVVDGQWKLMFSHCMMQRKNFIRGLPLLNYPNVCTNSPQSGKAFCDEHMEYLKEKHPQVPTDIHGFLKYCGIQRDDTGPGDETSDTSIPEELHQDKDVSKVEHVLSLLGDEAASHLGNSAVEAQGNTGFIEKEHDAVTTVLQDCLEPQPTTCNKETGGKQRLQKWSRGHLFIVRGGGIIDKWSPLFKSESPSQVFIIVLSWLFIILKAINQLNWGKVFLAYDNMCHLDGLKAARSLLPWPSPWDKAWISIRKVIDSLHIRNHKDKSCQENYNPASLKNELPDGNTMAAEQTFVWLSRFKKILCAMPKVHHLFYLHRMVKRRNKYTVNCYKNGKKPLLPKARGKARQTGQNC